MPEESLRPHSLILYKNRPGRILHVNKKLEIEVEGNQILKVRPKDVVLLHPGPIHSLDQLTPQTGEVTEAWTLLAGETVTLRDLTELIYGQATPATTWAAWQLVMDGLYFSGTPESVTAHTPEVVTQLQTARETKAAEERAWANFLNRIKSNQFLPEDGRFMQDVVALALGQKETSHVLQTLKRAQTPQNAHAFLLAHGYWDYTVNPYPQRVGIPTTPPQVALPDLPDEPRRDLTHLPALAIDDEGNQDPDDALSLENGRLWVHIADVAALIPSDTAADHEARTRGANLYLPEGVVPMIPFTATHQLGLGLHHISPALSFGLDMNPNGTVARLEIVPSWVRVTRLTYAEAEAQIHEPPFQALHQLAQTYQMRRRRNGAIEISLPEVKVEVNEGEVIIRPLHPLRSRDLVREAMLMTGEAVAHFALQHNIPVPFTVQEEPDLTEPTADGLADMFARRRMMKRSQQVSKPGSHAGLGMGLYTQSTSPLRRYLDLVVHQQLRAYLRGEEILDAQAVMARVGAVDIVTGHIRKVERQSITHWTMAYLLQNPQWQGEGVLVDKRGTQGTILIPELGIETQMYQRQDLPLNSIIPLSLKKVKLAHLEAFFR